MDILTRTEEIILLAVHRLGDNAYGVTIRQEVEKLVGKSYSVGAIYVPLDRMAERGWLTTDTGSPTAVRGGRAKRFYELTPAGKAALLAAKQLHEYLWSGVTNLGLEGGT
jgi:PadR family transcriptional regulator, regulatory protein PadR